MKKVTAIVLVLAMCATFSACGNTKVTKTAKTQPTQAVTEEPTAEPTEEPEILVDLKKKAEITSDVKMKVNSVAKEKKITSGNLYYKPKKNGNAFVLVNVTLNNLADSAKSFDLGYFRLHDSDGKEYIPTLIASSTDKYKFILINNMMDAKYKKTGCIAFEVPKDTKVKKCKLCYNDSGIQTNTFFSLK